MPADKPAVSERDRGQAKEVCARLSFGEEPFVDQVAAALAHARNEGRREALEACAVLVESHELGLTGSHIERRVRSVLATQIRYALPAKKETP